MRADRLVVAPGLPYLVLLGHRQGGDRVETADRLGRVEAGSAQLLAIEAGAREEVRDLAAVKDVVDRRLALEGQRLDFGLEHQASSPPS